MGVEIIGKNIELGNNVFNNNNHNNNNNAPGSRGIHPGTNGHSSSHGGIGFGLGGRSATAEGGQKTNTNGKANNNTNCSSNQDLLGIIDDETSNVAWEARQL